MSSPLSTALRTVSVVLCLIVALSMLLFAVDQTSTASGHQQEELTGQVQTHSSKESGLHRTIDEVAEEVTSPVSGVASSNDGWSEHTVRLLFALVVYGFALGYLARVLRLHN
jgi:hypothetical protein